jgi:prepilin signal peptidase PulO-like enzyme (type II secretory pathway)
MIFLLSFLLMSGIVAVRLWRDGSIAVESDVPSGSPATLFGRGVLSSRSSTASWVTVGYALTAILLGCSLNIADAAAAITLAYLLVGTWTDIRSHEVYLPLTIATAVAVIGADAMRPEFGLRLSIAIAIILAGMAAHKAMRGRSFGMADIYAMAIVYLGFGPSGVYALGYAVVIGAIVGVALIGGRLATRKTALPLFPFIALGAVVLQVFGVYPRLAIGGLG